MVGMKKLSSKNRVRSTRGRSLINTRQINANNIYNIYGHPCHWPSAWCPGPADPNTRTLTSCTLVVVVRIAHIYFYPVAVTFRLLCSVFAGEIPSTATLCQKACAKSPTKVHLFSTSDLPPYILSARLKFANC